MPVMRAVGIVGPVENTTDAPSFIALLRRSLSPGRSVIVYAVFGRKPWRGRTSIRDRW
jgi:hypothetical protein